MYPLIEINIKDIIENVNIIKKLCEKNNIELSVVTKLLVDDKNIVKAIVDCGINSICEARIQNFIDYKDLEVEKWLIRLPMLCEIPDVIKYSDVSLNSEISTIRELNKEAKKQGKIHKIILMYEIGDIREGCLKDELEVVLQESLKLDNIEVYGLGISLSCFGEIIPTEENMKELADLVKELEEKYSLKFKIVSGGNTCSYRMLESGKLPKSINNLRIGEAIFQGTIISLNDEIEYLHKDNFKLKAQIVEVKKKPSVPRGTKATGKAFLDETIFKDIGIRKKAIINIGKQDVMPASITPTDDKIIVLGGSSDYIILDINDCEKDYKVGDIVEFNLNYSGILSLMSSKFVARKYITD